MSGIALRRTLPGLAACFALSAGCAAARPPEAVSSSSVRRDAAERGVTDAQAAPPGDPSGAGGQTPSDPSGAGTPTTNIRSDETSEDKGSAEGGPSHDPHRSRRTLGWISLAVGAEAATAAVVSSFMLLHQKSVLDDNCNAQKQCSSVGVGAAGAIHETVPWNTGTWIVAAVGLTAGTIILLTSRSDSGKTTAVTVSPATAGAALGVRSQF